jgi:hypothetical protein
MPERQYFRLAHARARLLARQAIAEAPDGFIVEIKPPTRSSEQNAKLHAMLSEISKGLEWHGQKLSVTDWKRMFCAAIEGVRVVPGIVPGTFVPVGMRTRDMTIAEMSDLIEFINAFAAEHGLVFRDVREVAR